MSGFDLGAPIGSRNTVPSQGFDQGEHGAGTGLSGGHGHVNASNTQAGQYAQDERSGFNAGVGGNHASGGLPSGTPIADKFTSGSGNTPDPYGSSTGTSTGTVPTGHHGHHHSHHEGAGVGSGTGAKLDNSLDQYSGTGSRVGGVGSGTGAGAGEAVAGAYEGGGTRDGLTGQSGAHTTGSGVGVGGENLTTHSHDHHARDAALAGTAGGAGALAGAEAFSHSGSHGSHGAAAGSTAPLDRGEGVAGLSGGLQPGVGGETGSGVGPSGGSGGHYDTGSSSGLGAGVGAGAAGAGAAGLGAGASHGHGTSGRSSDGPSDPTSGSGGAGKYGRAEAHDGQGQPLTNPKDIDTGGPHSLVYQESTGQYVHRRELEGAGHAAKENRSTH
ncbi:hypothetical protein IAU59_004747 [Kwoniella sp. CBS 9459]